jgi:hypothetical protein
MAHHEGGVGLDTLGEQNPGGVAKGVVERFTMHLVTGVQPPETERKEPQ